MEYHPGKKEGIVQGGGKGCETLLTCKFTQLFGIVKNSSLTNVDRCVSGWEATAAAGQGGGLISGPFAEEAQDRKQLFNES